MTEQDIHFKVTEYLDKYNATHPFNNLNRFILSTDNSKGYLYRTIDSVSSFEVNLTQCILTAMTLDEIAKGIYRCILKRLNEDWINI